eukprot:8347796-Pyramimonas_sp.AAC.1
MRYPRRAFRAPPNSRHQLSFRRPFWRTRIPPLALVPDTAGINLERSACSQTSDRSTSSDSGSQGRRS